MQQRIGDFGGASDGTTVCAGDEDDEVGNRFVRVVDVVVVELGVCWASLKSWFLKSSHKLKFFISGVI